MTPGHTAATTSEDVTDRVLTAMAAAPDGRLTEIVVALVRYLHELAREVRLQPGELLRAAEFLTECGRISDAARHEFLLLSDTLGLTMVVDTLAADPLDGALESSVLGPFYRAGAPWVDNGDTLSRGRDDGDPVRVSGRVLDITGHPVPGAVLDVWGTNAHGRYENVDPAQPDNNLRGRIRARDDGSFDFWTAKPVSYPVPDDGPAGRLLRAMNRHNMRPAHLHLIVTAPGHRTVVTELFTADDPYLDSDAVFGVKPSLVVSYRRSHDAERAEAAGVSDPFWTLEHDIVLVAGDGTEVTFSTDAAGPGGGRAG